MKVYVDEEYGYGAYCWDYPGTAAELIADWNAGRVPVGIGYLDSTEFRGTIEAVTRPTWGDDLSMEYIEEHEEELYAGLTVKWKKFMTQFDAECHIHEERDSGLCVNGEYYGWLKKE